MTRTFSIVTFVLFVTAAPFAAEQTWTGQISDSACGAKHEEVVEGLGRCRTARARKPVSEAARNSRDTD
jgi:hypothetical protein